MIDFMIIGMPRSGTTWLSNLFNTGDFYCKHDPLYEMHYSEIDQKVGFAGPYVKAGVSCTALWKWPEWVNEHPSRKLIVHRSLVEINASLDGLGLPRIPTYTATHFDSIIGLHMPYESIWDYDAMADAFEYLTDRPLDINRYRELLRYNVQPNFGRIEVDKGAIKKLYNELASL